jgi:hypothetical protein
MVFDLNPFKPVTFSSTAKNKVTKKKPLATMFFIQLLLRFSGSPQCAPGTLRLNLHPCKLPHSISKITGEHTCEGRAKAAAVPPKTFCSESNRFTTLAVLIICYKRLKITILRFMGKNSRLDGSKKLLKTIIYVRWI